VNDTDHLEKMLKDLQREYIILVDEKKNLQALYEQAEMEIAQLRSELRFLKYEIAGGMRR